MNTLRSFTVVVAASLFLSGCLLTTDVNELLDDIEKRQLAVIIGSSLPEAEPKDLASSTKSSADITETEEKIRAFIEKYPNEKNIITPLYVRLGVLHITAGNEISALEAFDDARSAGGELGSTLMAYRDLGAHFYWWHNRKSVNWVRADGDHASAESLIGAFATRIDSLSDGEALSENRETLMWLHNVRFRSMTALTRQQSGAISEKETMTRLNPEVLSDYLDFWQGNGDALEDAKLLWIDFGHLDVSGGVPVCKGPGDIKKLSFDASRLRDIESLRWSIQVFCNVSMLMTLYYENVNQAYEAPRLDVSDRDWIRCAPYTDAEGVVCVPVPKPS